MCLCTNLCTCLNKCYMHVNIHTYAQVYTHVYAHIAFCIGATRVRKSAKKALSHDEFEALFNRSLP